MTVDKGVDRGQRGDGMVGGGELGERNGRTKWLMTLTCCVTYTHAKESDFSVISHIARVKEQTKMTFEMCSE